MNGNDLPSGSFIQHALFISCLCILFFIFEFTPFGKMFYGWIMGAGYVFVSAIILALLAVFVNIYFYNSSYRYISSILSSISFYMLSSLFVLSASNLSMFLRVLIVSTSLIVVMKLYQHIKGVFVASCA